MSQLNSRILSTTLAAALAVAAAPAHADSHNGQNLWLQVPQEDTEALGRINACDYAEPNAVIAQVIDSYVSMFHNITQERPREDLLTQIDLMNGENEDVGDLENMSQEELAQLAAEYSANLWVLDHVMYHTGGANPADFCRELDA